MIRTQILLTPTLYDALKLMAERERKSLSALIRTAVEKLVMKKKRSGREILQRMAKHAFYDPKIPKDLSTNDEYLYGKKAHYGLR